MYKSEEEFLKNYHVNDYKQLSLTVDLLIFSVSEEDVLNYRKKSKKKMSILLVKRDNFPYKDKWTLPGGFINPDSETLIDCARRILKNETNLSNIYLEQLYTFDGLNRDPRCRVISTSYMALVDKNRLNNKLASNASWFDIIDIDERKNEIAVVLDNKGETISFKVNKKLKEMTNNNYTYTIKENNFLAFDHPLVIITGLLRLKNKINYTDIVFSMMPKYFTLGELQQVYEVILGKKLLDPAFRRIIKDKVIKTENREQGKGHRPSVLYRYKNNISK